MRRRALLPLLLTLLGAYGGATPAHAETTTVRMPGKFFDPARSTVVAGDVVVFENDDLVTHDVRIAGGLYDSGPILRFRSWLQQFQQPGGYPFVCTLHPFMSGNLEVLAATLAATPDSLLAGEPIVLSGRAPAGTVQVAVEQSMAGGAWTALGGATPARDGRFQATAPAVVGASYRVTTPAGASRAVVPRVQARVDLHVNVARTRRRTSVRVHTMPTAKRFTVTLELYSRWHFRWRVQRRARVDSHGGATFRLPAAQRTLARVALSRGRRSPVLARSGVVSLRTGRAATDPDAIGAAGPGHDGHG
jgi:plastocyanin